VLVEFNRAPGYGDSVQVEMDVVPRKGDGLWDGRSHAVRSVTLVSERCRGGWHGHQSDCPCGPQRRR